jgi:hypothetical protein
MSLIRGDYDPAELNLGHGDRRRIRHRMGVLGGGVHSDPGDPAPAVALVVVSALLVSTSSRERPHGRPSPAQEIFEPTQ